MQDKMISIEEYYAVKARSQSELKALAKGLGSYKKASELYFREEEHFLIGSALDALLFTPMDFQHKFYVSQYADVKQTGKLQSAAVRLWDKIYEDPFYSGIEYKDVEDIPELEILDVLDQEGYNPNWKEATRIKKFRSEMGLWWGDKVQCGDREMLSDEQYNEVWGMVDKLRTHEFTRDVVEKIGKGKMIVQTPILFNYRGHQCKALPDALDIDHERKKIFIWDLKSTSDSVLKFGRSIKRFRYDVQMAWYKLACQQEYPGYEISTGFIVVNNTEEHPLLWEMSVKDEKIGRWGAHWDVSTYVPIQFLIDTEKEKPGSTGYTEESSRELYKADVLGYEQMLYLWEWHYEHEQWEYDKYIVESEGFLSEEVWR